MILGSSKVIYQLLSNRIYVAVIISRNWISESVLRYKFVRFYQQRDNIVHNYVFRSLF